MVLFHHDIDESIRIGHEAAAYCSQFMPKPVLLLFENVKYPFILLGKKKYICYEYKKSSKEKPKFDTKGTVSKRRDSCLFIKELVEHISNIWAGKVKCPDGVPRLIHSINVARQKVTDLKSGNVRFHKIIFSKGLNKPALEYTSTLTTGIYTLMKRKTKFWKRVKSFYKRIGVEMFIKALEFINNKNVPDPEIREYINKQREKKKNNNNNNLYSFFKNNKNDMKLLIELIKEWGSYNVIKCIEVVKSGAYVHPGKKMSPPAHVIVTLKLAKQNPGNEPRSGDRVPFMVIKGPKKSRVCDRAESPETVLKNKLSIDYEYVANNKVIKALGRLFSPMLGTHTFDHINYEGWDKKRIDKESKKVIEANRAQAIKILFSDITTKTKIKLRTWGAITKYTVVVPKCLSCKCRLKSSNKRRKVGNNNNNPQVDEYLCKDCKPNKKELLSKYLHKRNKLKDEDYASTIQCKLCQMERYGKVTCANNECWNFHLRKELKNDIEDIDKTVSRLTKSFCKFSLNTKANVEDKIFQSIKNGYK